MAKRKPKIDLQKEDQEKMTDRLKEYIEENFEIEIGRLQASIFLDYITENIAPFYYNKGIVDSMNYITERADDMYVLMKEED